MILTPIFVGSTVLLGAVWRHRLRSYWGKQPPKINGSFSNMEIIAIGELREFLQINHPKFEDPVIFISSNFLPGCPKCNTSTSVYYIKLTERSLIPSEDNLQKAQNHKFPIDIYVHYPVQTGKPKQFVIGTKRSYGKLEMMLRRVVE